MKTVAILGGGISGLAVAERLGHMDGYAPVVFDAASEPGGKIQSRHHDGYVVETGPHGFLDKEPAIFELIDRLGLRAELIPANDDSANRYIVRGGRLRRLPSKPQQFIASDILPLSGRLRILLEPFIGRGSAEIEESVWGFARRRLGVQAANVLVDAFVTGIYGGDPKALSVSAAFPRLAELEAEFGGLIRAQVALQRQKRITSGTTGGPSGTLYSFRRGLGTLTDALAKRVDVRTDAKVQCVEADGDAFRVIGDWGEYRADRVVCTLPSYEAARVFSKLDGAADAGTEIPYASIAVVVQGFKKDRLPPLDGFGFLCPGGENRSILGSIWASTVFAGHAPEGRAMFRTMLGGARRSADAEGTDDELKHRSLADLSSIMQVPRDEPVDFDTVIRWPRGIPQYTIGHRERVARLVAIEDRFPGLYFGGNALFGVAMIQCVAHASTLCARITASQSARNSS